MTTPESEMIIFNRHLESTKNISGLFKNFSTLSDLESPRVDPVSDEVREIFQVAVFFVLSGLTSLFGTCANSINITVFITLGFRDSINISLLGLAIADLGCVLTMLWMSLSYSPLLMSPDLTFSPLDVMYVTGGWPHVYFNRITSIITAFITIERCLCVTVPLKVKNIITHSRTKAVIAGIFLAAVAIFAPMFYVNQLDWRFIPSKNRSILSLVFTEDRVQIETITLPIYSVGMSAISLIIVIVCTTILIVELNRKTKWRQLSMSKNITTIENASIRDKKVLKMVTLISLIFITCYTPATINFLMMAFAPEFSLAGKYGNVFFIVWSLTVLIETINSSVNIFVYLKMSSKFKAAFRQTFCCCFK